MLSAPRCCCTPRPPGCSRGTSTGVRKFGSAHLCSLRRATKTLPCASAAGVAPAKEEQHQQHQQQWWVESELLKWGVEDASTAKDLLVTLRASGLQKPWRLGVATVLSDVVPQLLVTAAFVLGSCFCFKAIAWAFVDTQASLLLRCIGGLLGAGSGISFFWPEALLGIVKTAGYLYSGIRYGLHAGDFLDAVKSMAARPTHDSDSHAVNSNSPAQAFA